MKNLILGLSIALLLTPAAAAQDWALEELDASPRHHEWISIRQRDRTVEAFLTYPEASVKRPAIVVIHENRGLTDWVRLVTDRLAEEGYIAIAPDLLSGMGPGGGKTSDFADSDAAREGIYRLPPEQVTADLEAVVRHVGELPAFNGTVAVAGFCWGGSQTFRFAAGGTEVAAAFVFYGTAPQEEEAFARIQSPVYGFYGGDDARVNATLAETQRLIEANGKTFEPVIYEGAGHAFMRRGHEENEGPNKKAHDEAWQRWRELLKSLE